MEINETSQPTMLV